MIDIDKAFEGRWRIKGRSVDLGEVLILGDALPKAMKELCRDFFEAGLALGQRDCVPLDKLSMKQEYPLTQEECEAPPPCRVKESDILTVQDTFKKWWDMYDLKCGKENCMKKWKKLTAKEQFDCIRATPAYVASTPDKQYRKRPLTYLNQKAWNDEIIPHNNGNKPTSDPREKLGKILAP